MRVCQKHREPATITLRDLRSGTEYDLCPICAAEMEIILNGKPEEKKRGRK
jgi:hypothetical protein